MIMKNTKCLLHLVLLFLLLPSLFSSVPASRILNSYEGTPALHDFQVQGIGIEEEEMLVVLRRMDLESEDYPGTGANNRHDPKTPGTV